MRRATLQLPGQFQWQPFIDVVRDTQTHEPLEEDLDRFPLLLLDAPGPPPTDNRLQQRLANAAWQSPFTTVLEVAIQIPADAPPPPTDTRLPQRLAHFAWADALDWPARQPRALYPHASAVVAADQQLRSNVDQVAIANAWLSDPQPQQRRPSYTEAGAVVADVPPPRSTRLIQQLAHEAWAAAARVVPLTAPVGTDEPAGASRPRDVQVAAAFAWLVEPLTQQPRPRYPHDSVVVTAADQPRPRDLQSQIARAWTDDQPPQPRGPRYIEQPVMVVEQPPFRRDDIAQRAWTDAPIAPQRGARYTQGLDAPPPKVVQPLAIQLSWLPADWSAQTAPKYVPLAPAWQPSALSRARHIEQDAWEPAPPLPQRSPRYPQPYTPDAPPPLVRQPSAIQLAWRIDPDPTQRQRAYTTENIVAVQSFPKPKRPEPWTDEGWPAQTNRKLPQPYVPDAPYPTHRDIHARVALEAWQEGTTGTQLQKRRVVPASVDAPPVRRRGDLGAIAAWWQDTTSAAPRARGYPPQPAVVNNPPFDRRARELIALTTAMWWAPEPPRRMSARLTPPPPRGDPGARLLAHSSSRMIDTGPRDARATTRATDTGPRRARSVRRR